MIRIITSLLGLLGFLGTAFGAQNTFQLESSVFKNNQNIPTLYTCQGKNTPIPLSWKNVPAGTASVAIIMHDPDAPMGNLNHWVIYNIPSAATEIPQNKKSPSTEYDVGLNSWKRQAYEGPCPPSGPAHHYTFDLYALDSMLKFKNTPTGEDLVNAIQNNTLAHTQLIGLYAKK